MNEAVNAMLGRYDCKTGRDFENALKEIIQEIALLGLWRSKFYEKAAFYGGSALRILHKIGRFSEDLDFTLLRKVKNFSLDKYNKAIEIELKSFGFDVEVNTKNKNVESNIESAFIKTNTKKQFIYVNVPKNEIKRIHNQRLIKIKLEVDVDPAVNFDTEVKPLLQPIPFNVHVLKLPDLFAGKIHALLCRNWKKRVKGRDWYDFVWYIGNNVPVRADYLKEKLLQSGVKLKAKKFDKELIVGMLIDKVNEVDFTEAKNDILPFIKDSVAVDLWAKDFFELLVKKIQLAK